MRNPGCHGSCETQTHTLFRIIFNLYPVLTKNNQSLPPVKSHASLYARAFRPGSILLADQHQVLIFISLKMIMDLEIPKIIMGSSKNGRWIIPFYSQLIYLALRYLTCGIFPSLTVNHGFQLLCSILGETTCICGLADQSVEGRNDIPRVPGWIKFIVN